MFENLVLKVLEIFCLTYVLLFATHSHILIKHRLKRKFTGEKYYDIENNSIFVLSRLRVRHVIPLPSHTQYSFFH